MSKRIWIVGAVLLALVLSACGSGDLAEDLTPIPTLSSGEATPTLVAAIQSGAVATQEAGGEAAATEAAGEQPAATQEAGGEEAVAGDATVGEELFAANCAGCHGAEDGAGPALTGMGERAGERVEGMPAEEYLHESIVDPSAHVVEGFSDIMPKTYDEQFSDEELNGLVAYLMTQ